MAISTQTNKRHKKEIQEYRGKVLEWYDMHGRELPWRYKNGDLANPYHVWLSEIMCQQTTVQAVIPYYTKFLSTWPTIQDLANADNDAVMAAWAGLGYYARARNLHKCAKIVANDLGGVFPNTQDGLKSLPGVGDYTSAAIANIAFNQSSTVMDGNIERIVARFFNIEDALPKAKSIFKSYASQFFDGFDGFEGRSGDFAQALMDIGSSLCTPKKPKCVLCPLKLGCKAHILGIEETLPAKTKGKARPHKFGEVYWITNEKGEVLFHKRPEKGLLAGMTGLPTSSWEIKGVGITKPSILNDFPNKNIKKSKSTINHVFTHFDLTLSMKIYILNNTLIDTDGFYWAAPSTQAHSLPTVFKKSFVEFMIQYKRARSITNPHSFGE